MNENKSSISKASSYEEIGEFWDTHDVTDYWDLTEAVDFEVDIESEIRLLVLEPSLASKTADVARRKGVSLETLVNLWVRDRLEEELSDHPVAS
jgi:hypothetical protein